MDKTGHPDDKDMAILRLLQEDCRMNNQLISKALEAHNVILDQTAVSKRIKALQAGGVIRGWRVLIDREKVDLEQSILILVALEKHNAGRTDDFEQAINTGFPNVIECMKVSGSWDYVVKVVARSLKQCGEISDRLSKIENVSRTRGMPVYGEKDAHLPLGKVIGMDQGVLSRSEDIPIGIKTEPGSETE